MVHSDTINIIWVGDKPAPKDCIESWIDNSGLEVNVWGNDELQSLKWHTQPVIDIMLKTGQLNGVANMMRYEILHEYGGICVDADSYCIKKLPDWLIETKPAICWENEIVRRGLICAGYMNFPKQHGFISDLIYAILHNNDWEKETLSWKTTGAVPLTYCLENSPSANELTIWPSHFFYPKHYTGMEYKGNGFNFAHQEWATTKGK